MTGVFGVVLGQILLMFLYLIIGYVCLLYTSDAADE